MAVTKRISTPLAPASGYQAGGGITIHDGRETNPWCRAEIPRRLGSNLDGD